jgi:hypothetical protein
MFPGADGHRVFPPEVVVAIKAVACELPATAGVPLTRWHCQDLARAAVDQGIVASISDTTVWRWLSADAIKPCQHQSWIFPRDLDFARLVPAVCSTCITADGRVASWANVTTSSARTTRPRSKPASASIRPAQPGAKRAMRVEHEYARGGALAYLAAWDVHRGKVYGRCEPTTGIDPFGRLVAQVMAAEPYASARRVFGSWTTARPTAGKASIDRLQQRWPRLRLIHLPVHASWLNQVEIYFCVVQRKVLTPNDFADLDEVEVRLLAFQAHYEQIATPFEWKFTRKDLNALLARTAGQALDSAA